MVQVDGIWAGELSFLKWINASEVAEISLLSPTESAEVGVASGPLVDAEGSVFFGGHDEFVYSLSAQGALRWVHPVGGAVDASPILTADGTLVIGGDDGVLRAIGESAPGDAGAP